MGANIFTRGLRVEFELNSNAIIIKFNFLFNEKRDKNNDFYPIYNNNSNNNRVN